MTIGLRLRIWSDTTNFSSTCEAARGEEADYEAQWIIFHCAPFLSCFKGSDTTWTLVT